MAVILGGMVKAWVWCLSLSFPNNCKCLNQKFSIGDVRDQHLKSKNAFVRGSARIFDSSSEM